MGGKQLVQDGADVLRGFGHQSLVAQFGQKFIDAWVGRGAFVEMVCDSMRRVAQERGWQYLDLVKLSGKGGGGGTFVQAEPILTSGESKFTRLPTLLDAAELPASASPDLPNLGNVETKRKALYRPTYQSI